MTKTKNQADKWPIFITPVVYQVSVLGLALVNICIKLCAKGGIRSEKAKSADNTELKSRDD